MPHTFKRSLLFSAALVGLWLAARLVLPLMLPFLLGLFLALMTEPGVKFLVSKLHVPRPLAAGLTVSALVAGLGLLALLLAALAVSQLGVLKRILPTLAGTVQSGIFLLQNWLLGFGSGLPAGLQDGYRQAVGELFSGGTALLGKISSLALGTAGTMLTSLPDKALTLGTALLSGYMFSAKLPKFRHWLHRHLPSDRYARLMTHWSRLCTAGKLWLTSQAKLMGVTFAILLFSLLLLRVPYALLLAGGIALVDALPVLGTGTVLLPWALVSILSGNTPRALGLLGCYATAALVRSVLEPRLVGSQLGLDPLVTLVAMYCGYKLFGLAGMLLLPLLAATVFQVLPEEGS